MDKWIKENKITTAIVVVLVVAFGVGWFDGGEVKTEKVVQTTDFDLQAKCATQAKLAFEYYVVDPKDRQTEEYSNHYNTKLNKCFVLIKRGSASVLKTKELFDAIEKKPYGTFYNLLTTGVPDIDCEMYLDGDKNNLKNCTSEKEFDDFVSGYMES